MARRPRGVDPDQELEAGKSYDQRIIDEAKYRFRRAQEWEGGFRKLYTEDVKFANGDSDNGWQWPENIKRDRDLRNLPTLTVNKTKMHVLLLANEARQNPPQARVKPVGEKVSYDAAQVWEGLVRHIEYISNAQSIYIHTKEAQLEGGIGYLRLGHDFVDDRSFDQELRIEPLETLNTYLDCDIKRVDGSDAMWAFIYDEWDRKEFAKRFPDIRLPPPARGAGLDNRDDWIRNDAIRVAEYYRINLEEDELIYIEETDGSSWTGLRSEMPSPWRDDLEAYAVGDKGADYKARKLMVRQLQWFKLAGDWIIDRNDGSDPQKKPLKGHYIPIARMVGRERIIENKLYRAGIVRTLKDQQRMYNYNSSGQVEVVALQTKTPWIIAAEAIEGNEAAWNNANRSNAAYLTYRAFDEDGNKIDPPQRLAPPVPAQGFLEGLRIAAAEMEMATGQYQGQQQNPNPMIERSPRAIDERSRMGQLANYDFTDNEMQCVRHLAVMIIDLAPHIYDTERVVKIRAADGTISDILIKPDQDVAYKDEKPTKEGEAIKVLFNPKIGKFAVEADVGPAYQTQREEAWNAFVQIVGASPELMGIIGDLGFLAADWPMADKIAERLRRQIEQTAPWLLKDGQVGPLVQKLQTDLQTAQQQNADLMERLADARIKLKGKDEMRNIDVYDANTRRLSAEAGAVEGFLKLDEGGILAKMIQKTVGQMLGFSLEDIEKANAEAIANQSEGKESAAANA